MEIILELEIDPFVHGSRGDSLVDTERFTMAHDGISIRVQDFEGGHGFGMGEIITIVVSVATGVSSDLIATTIKEATKGIIRRVRTSRGRSDGSVEGVTTAIDAERQASVDPAAHADNQ